MAKTFELFGLISFNAVLGVVLSATFLGGAEGAKIARLTEDNVTHFISDMKEVTAGTKEDFDHYAIIQYLQDRIYEGGQFINRVSYDLPYTSHTEQIMEMDKKTYISHVLKSLGNEVSRRQDLVIEYIEVNDSGTGARVTTLSREQGEVPMERIDGQTVMVPVHGVSYCDQELTLDESSKTIQIKDASCTTDITQDAPY